MRSRFIATLAHKTVEKCIWARTSLARENCRHAPRNAPWAPFISATEYEDAIINSKGETIQLFKAIRQSAGFQPLEEQCTDPRIYYLPAAKRKYSGPDELEEEAAAEKKS